MTRDLIRVENLSKRYQLGQREQYQALRDVVAEYLGRPWQLLRIARRPTAGTQTQRAPAPKHFWALNNVNFNVKQGEVIGVIGRNGAGKSTLLKILARITKPSAGVVRLRGRVGSLLEVGTGFHPELTGRENVYLNGAVLGMHRREITRKFDEIVAFAEVEEFLDTPVKRYSSGMHMRLAFAVAAHLEPEILLVDEVLAVGDAAFQKKCLGKMGQVAEQGRTVIFVSHNMNAVQRLCPRSIFLDHGELLADGDTARVLSQYLAQNVAEEQPADWITVSDRYRRGTGQARVVALEYRSDSPAAAFQPYPMGPMEVSLAIESDAARKLGSIAVILYDKNGTKLINADTVSLGQVVELKPGRNLVRFKIHELYLNPGIYVLGWWLASPLGTIHDFAESALRIEVVDLEHNRLGAKPRYDGTVACRFQLVEGQVQGHENGP
jgi:lipopolysaccharide transport system ATP-binding protein